MVLILSSSSFEYFGVGYVPDASVFLLFCLIVLVCALWCFFLVLRFEFWFDLCVLALFSCVFAGHGGFVLLLCWRW